jgi:formamidopyrimidine-DNA glycosylase
MKAELVGRTIGAVQVLQPKCLNVTPDEFAAALTGATISDVSCHGKWLFVDTTRGWLLLNQGMGGEILLVTRDSLPEKYRLVFDFADGTCLAINYWWFGYAHHVPAGQLEAHAMSAKLGPNALDLSVERLQALLKGQRKRIKALLLDQSQIAGIGNAYIHDILFLAHLHPLRLANSLTDVEIDVLHQAIHTGLQPSLDKGGAFYEKDLHGNKGGFALEDILIGYREGKPCPVCGTPIEKIKTASTSSFICPSCQPAP